MILSISPIRPTEPLPVDRRAYALLVLLFLVSLAVAMFTEGTYDSGDSINHFLYARHAFQHPINFLESWSKPVVVQLMAGPAQFGLRGVMVLQCVLMAVSAGFAYLAARHLRLPWPWLTIVFCYAAPDYFRIQFSGLTEPTFSALLMAGIALLLSGRAQLGAAVLSFLPFARSEGFILIAVVGAYLVLANHWRVLPWLLLAFVLYGVAGVFVYQDFFWVFTRNAYPVRNIAYGHGEWQHFIVNLPHTVGWVLYGLFWLGGMRMLAEWLKPALRLSPGVFWAELLLVYGCVVVFIAAHTIFWALGIFASFGLIRVLCGIVPLVVLIALRGVYLLGKLGTTAKFEHRIRMVLVAGVVIFLLSGARAGLRWERDFGRASDQILADSAVQWAFRHSELPHVIYAHPYFAVPLGLDHFGTRVSHPYELPAPQSIPAGTLVFWDEWYSVIEAKLPFNALRRNPAYRLRWLNALPRNRRKPTADSVRIAIFEKI